MANVAHSIVPPLTEISTSMISANHVHHIAPLSLPASATGIPSDKSEVLLACVEPNMIVLTY